MGRGRLIAFPARRIAWDTSAAIYFLAEIQPYAGWLRRQLQSLDNDGGELVLSVVVYHELLVGPLRARNMDDLGQVVRFCRKGPVTVAGLDTATARRAALIRAESHLATPDSLIIGTAEAQGCAEIVGNDAAWQRTRLGLRFRHLDSELGMQR